jgi:hypothetical protein
MPYRLNLLMRNFESMFPRLLRRLAVPVLAVSGLVSPGFSQALVGNSPFAGRAGSGGSAGPAAAYELAGSATQGSQVIVCIYERLKKRSEWIPVGESSGEIQVVSYDAASDSAVVTVDGARKDLVMRQATVASMAPSSDPRVPAAGGGLVASLVPAPSAPSTPQSVANEQREARMLVSDLLEIGVQQRKAYQDAKQKAAASASAQPTN